MRALRVAIVLAIGCVAASCDDDTSPADARDAGKPIVCCKLEAPSCDCTVIGTMPNGSCRTICDAAPTGDWRIETDERGCPYYATTGSKSCLRPPPGTEDGIDAPVGTACSATAECDLSGLGRSTCSLTEFGDAAGVCIRTDCDVTAATCDSGRGTCLELEGGPYCVPRCTFGDDGAAPVGCGTRAACWSRGRDTTTSEVRGVGACLAGCSSDGDCSAGWRCQRETGTCETSVYTPTKNVGDSCTSSDECYCVRRSTGGYCTSYCRVGAEAACPSGFVCDPWLPTEFTTAPSGLSGICDKTCTTDADCAALNATCVAAGGLSTKVCRPK